MYIVYKAIFSSVTLFQKHIFVSIERNPKHYNYFPEYDAYM